MLTEPLELAAAAIPPLYYQQRTETSDVINTYLRSHLEHTILY